MHQFIYSKSLLFLNKICKDLYYEKIDISPYLIDHICYRVSSQKSYCDYKNKMLAFGELLSENIIANRPIAVFKLQQPIRFQEREIFLFELPSPKPDTYYREGYEHIEVVIDTTLENWMDQYAHLPFNAKGLKTPVNRSIKLKLPSGTVKFHEQSLEEVIAKEKNQ